jgi:hypothetical protein
MLTPRPGPRIPWDIAATLLLGSLALVRPAGAQLAAEHLAPFPVRIQEGTGEVRLAGMGGFQTAVMDENNEINLLDYSGNPAGYSDDRDSWTIDLRYSHSEFQEGTESPASNDVKVNDGTFILGYHVPKRHGFGGAIDYTEAQTLDVSSNMNKFNVVGMDLIGNVYLLPKMSLGGRGGYASENQNLSTNEFYFIEHKGHLPHIGGGVAYFPARGITLGFRADGFPTTIDGTSANSTHQDEFTWDRPGSDWSAHGFLDRGRVQLGVDYDRLSVQGKESVRISWSTRYLYNPGPTDYAVETDTFSEDRSTKTFRIRGRLDVIPGRLNVSGAWGKSDGDFKVIDNPNVLGSLSEGTAGTSTSDFLAGASYTMLESRLLLAGEIQARSADLDRTTQTTNLHVSDDNVTLRLGGEYLVGEKLAARAGIVRGNEDLSTVVFDPAGGSAEDPARSGSFNSWRLATGVGIIPWGAIWQMDLAYDVTLHSDSKDDLSRFSAYVRYLF